MNSRTTPRRRTRRLLALGAAAALLGVACGSGSDDATVVQDDPATEAPASQSADDTAAGDVPEILRFTNALVGGGELDAAELAGKPTAFWFWAPD